MTEEETVSLILQGCKLANHLESNIANLAKRPDIILSSCDDIVKIFSLARERVRDQGLCSHPQSIQMIDANSQEWFRSSTSSQTQSQETDIIKSQSSTSFHARGSLSADLGQVVGVRGSDGHSGSDVSDSGNPILPSRKSRKRKDGKGKLEVTVMVAAAPIMGNTELPPDDGFTWRKYGQKEILGSRFPRGYYRCTHQRLYQCPAKKQVQRLNDDPFTFQVTCKGEHTCHKSSTAPLVAPVPTFVVAQKLTTQASGPYFLSSPLVPFAHEWLSMELTSGSSSSAPIVGSGNTSAVRYGREADLMPVADIADAMFNSSTSSGNSMESIFPSMEPKWEPENETPNVQHSRAFFN